MTIFLYMVFVKRVTEKSNDVFKARKRMMDMLALRDHSELEMRKKLGQRFVPELVEQMIEEAKERKWLPTSPEEVTALAEKFAAVLHRRRKGVHWINRKLQESGLPALREDTEVEFEKALALARRNLSAIRAGKNPRARISRSLQAKGYSSGIIGRVLKSMEKELFAEEEVFQEDP